MEDLFQIIFIIIFILTSIVSSLKKNKKKGQSKPSQLARKQVQVKRTTDPFLEPKAKAKQKTSTEILEEMFGFKIDLPEPNKNRAPRVYSEENVDTWDPSKEYEKDHVQTEGISNYQEKILAKKNEYEVDKEKHRAFKDNAPIHQKVHKKSSKVRTLLQKQQSLKDLILIQEILNKPKALRR